MSSRADLDQTVKQVDCVNTVHLTGVDTPMVAGLGGLDPLITRDPELGSIFMNALPVEIIEFDAGHTIR